MNNARLLSSLEMESTLVPIWVNESFRQYHSVIMQPTFPCFFGQTGERNKELRYSYVTHDDWSSLAGTLQAFLTLMDEKPLVRRGLFIFVEPEAQEQPLRYYRTYFWDILNHIHQKDKKKWPEHIPKNPDHYLWSFCFHDKPLFAFANAPAYRQRKTRDLGQSLIIGFQPRVIFEGLEGTERKGIHTRQAIRKRAEAWDQIAKHPDISHYGDKSHREWKQFFISDDCVPDEGRCPFKAQN